MTAPLCPCGAVLPIGHPKSVITCPGCGAKSLPREAEPSTPRAPVDLTVALTRADVLEEHDFDAGAATIRAMAGEIEMLRAEVAAAQATAIAEERARLAAMVLDMRPHSKRDAAIEAIAEAVFRGSAR